MAKENILGTHFSGCWESGTAALSTLKWKEVCGIKKEWLTVARMLGERVRVEEQEEVGKGGLASERGVCNPN